MNKITLYTKWFSDKAIIKNYLNKELSQTYDELAKYNTYEEDAVRNCALIGSRVAALQVLSYAILGEGRKPEFAPRVTENLTSTATKEYISDIVSRLCNHPPSDSYAVLVYNQSLIRYLNTMEIK